MARPKTKPVAANACARDPDDDGKAPSAVASAPLALLPLTTRLTGTVMLGWRMARARWVRAVRFLVVYARSAFSVQIEDRQAVQGGRHAGDRTTHPCLSASTLERIHEYGCAFPSPLAVQGCREPWGSVAAAAVVHLESTAGGEIVKSSRGWVPQLIPHIHVHTHTWRPTRCPAACARRRRGPAPEAGRRACARGPRAA